MEIIGKSVTQRIKDVKQPDGRIYIQENRGIPDTPVTVRITGLGLVEVLRDNGQGGF